MKSELLWSRLIHAKPCLYALLENLSKRERTWQDEDEIHQNFHTILELGNVNVGVDKRVKKNMSGESNMAELALYNLDTCKHMPSVTLDVCFDNG